jgi:hypothetical protein
MSRATQVAEHKAGGVAFARTHRHQKKPVFKLVGYSERAPSYHLEVCTVGKCRVKRITYCPHQRNDREVHLGLKPICPICDA